MKPDNSASICIYILDGYFIFEYTVCLLPPLCYFNLNSYLLRHICNISIIIKVIKLYNSTTIKFLIVYINRLIAFLSTKIKEM